MTTLRMPRALRDVFGTRQSPVALALVVLAMPLAVVAVLPALGEVEWWRALLAGLLVADLAAGAVANLTRGTSDHYAASTQRRIVFLIVHLHLPLIAFLLGLPLAPALIAWALTIAAAAVVVALQRRDLHKPAAGLGVVIVLAVTAINPETTVVLLFLVALFAIKVVLSFGVDHFGKGDEIEA